MRYGQRVLVVLVMLALLTAMLALPSQAQTVFQTNTQTPVTVEQPADDAGSAAEATEAPADTVGGVIDDLVNAGEVALLEWYARQTERTQMILLAVVVAFGGVLTAVVFRGDARFAAFMKQAGATIDKLEDKALEAALKTPTVWDEQVVRLLIAFGDVIMPPKDVVATGADVSRDEVEADG